MGSNPLKLILLLFLCSSFIICTTAVPSSRSMIFPDHKPDSSVQSLLPQGNFDDWVEEGEKLQVKRRIDIQLTDYSSPGANRNHDPGNG